MARKWIHMHTYREICFKKVKTFWKATMKRLGLTLPGSKQSDRNDWFFYFIYIFMKEKIVEFLKSEMKNYVWLDTTTFREFGLHLLSSSPSNPFDIWRALVTPVFSINGHTSVLLPAFAEKLVSSQPPGINYINRTFLHQCPRQIDIQWRKLDGPKRI